MLFILIINMGQINSMFPNKNKCDFSKKELEIWNKNIDKVNSQNKSKYAESVSIKKVDEFAESVHIPYDLTEIINDIKKNWDKGILNLSGHSYLDHEDKKKLKNNGFYINGHVLELFPAIYKYSITWNSSDKFIDKFLD